MPSRPTVSTYRVIVIALAIVLVLLTACGTPGTPIYTPAFEIRTHMPAQPGRGYAAKDPTLYGWKPPSQFIWQQRIATSPGVQWARPPVSKSQGIGMLDQDTFIALYDGQSNSTM